MAEIELSGLAVEKEEIARKELIKLFGKINNLEISVTMDFDSTVTEYLQKRGVSEQYQYTRAGGEVVAGKVLNYPSNGQLGTCLAINANARMFSNWNDEFNLERMHILCHELGHIIIYQDRYRQTGQERFFSLPSSTDEWMDELANDIVDEYIVERNAVQTLLKECHPDPSPYFVERLKGLVEILAAHLQSFKAFTAEKVELYRRGAMLPVDFWGYIYLRTRDTLNALSLAAAIIDAIPSCSSLLEPIEINETYQQLFQNTWTEVEKLLAQFFQENSCKVGIKQASEGFRNLFQLFGMEFHDINGRMVISIKL
jgi:hypothetical protein